MLKRLLAHPYLHLITLAAILFGVFVCVLPEAVPRLSWVVNHAVQLMLAYLLLGVIMLFFKQPRLTFAFFGGCVLLCFFMKYATRGNSIEHWRQELLDSRLPDRQQPLITTVNQNLKIAHVNLTNANSRKEVFSILKNIDADLYSLHEVTPDWNQWLLDSLGDSYPHNHTMVDLGIYGMALYSKFPLMGVDTFFYHEIPNLKGAIEIGEEQFSLISIHTLPALDVFSKKRLSEHLDTVRKEVQKTDGPILVMGDFNAVSWSGQLQVFMDSTGLMESRSGFMPISLSGKISFFDIPLDHIFYSSEFACSNFQQIEGKVGQHLGILGTYQYVIRNNHVEKKN